MADVEPIITNQKEYEDYQRRQMEEDEVARANPTPTQQYDSPIGPERPTKISIREKVESKARGVKESILSKVGDIKKHYKEEAEYERKLAKAEREVKASPAYLKKKAEHELYIEELRARKQSVAPRRGSIKAMPSLITMGGYKSAYTGKSTAPSVSFGGGYQPAYTVQIPMGVVKPVRVTTKPVSKPKPVKITSFGSGAMPKMGNFGGSSLMPKIGGGGKKMETPRIGNFFGEIPKIGKSITHKGSVRSIDLNTTIHPIGDIPKIQFGIVKKAPVKRKTKRSKKR
jgi:hypothetical protein